MAQTPLHVSAGHNRAEIVKFLLDWQGADKVEMEAKNMVGSRQFFQLKLFLEYKYIKYVKSRLQVNCLVILKSFIYLCSTEKLRCTWQQRMGAMKPHNYFLLVVLLLKPEQM